LLKKPDGPSLEVLTMRFAALALATLAVVSILSGCGGAPRIVVAGKTYLNSQEMADSRTIEFKEDGTFSYSVVTADRTWRGSGTYSVGEGKVALTFVPGGELGEFAGKTFELEVDGQMLVDPDGSRWSVL
jgi:hypothetical protein